MFITVARRRQISSHHGGMHRLHTSFSFALVATWTIQGPTRISIVHKLFCNIIAHVDRFCPFYVGSGLCRRS